MTREDAINLIGSMKGDLCDLYDDNDLTALEMAISALKESKGEWIPVSERLPEKTGRYLCTVGTLYRNPREMYYAPQEWADKSDQAKWRSTDGSYVFDWFVKAWMPLPELYKS